MRYRFKLGLTLALACGLAIGIAACGGGGGDGDTGSSGETVAPAELSGTVTVWDLATGSFANYDPVNDKLIAEFEREYPNVKVDQVAQPFEGWESIYRAAFAAREGPDVMMMLTGANGVGFKAGLENLDDRISPELEAQITNWSTASDGYTKDGAHYGVPIGSTGQVFYYNKKLFEKAGLPREFEPQTWDEVREAGEKLKAAGIQPFTGGNKEGWENQWWFSAGWQTENTAEQSIELAEGEIPFTDEVVANALGPAILMQESGFYPADRFTTPLFPDGGARFGTEEGAMILGPQGIIGYWGEYNETLGEKNDGMFLPPGSKYLGTESEWAWSIPTFAQNKDAAWAFIEFMASKDSIGKFVEAGTFLPNRKDVSLPADASEQAKQLVEWSEEYELVPTAHSIVPSQVAFGPLSTEVNQVLQGRTLLEAAQEAMQETAEKSSR